MKVNDIYNFLNELYPVNTAAEFDNVGLLVGDGDSDVTRVLVALDCTKEAVKTAKENGCELIITHHPVIFDPIKEIIKDSVCYNLIKSGISAISMHTNLDIAEDGVNYWLCKTLALSEICPFPASDGFLLKSGVVAAISPEAFSHHIKSTLNTTVKYVSGKKPIKKVLVCSGSGGEYYKDAIDNNFDALITSEVKHHQFLDAFSHGISVFDAGHFATEDVIVEPLKKLLSKKFTDCQFLTFHENNIKYV